MQNLLKIQTALRFKDFISVLTSVLHFPQFLMDFINPVLTSRLNTRNLRTNVFGSVGPEIVLNKETENKCGYILASFSV